VRILSHISEIPTSVRFMPAPVIDCHTHCTPAALAEAPRAWAEARREPHWAELVAPTERPSLQDWTDPEDMLAKMDEARIDRAVLLGWYWENEETCRWQNRRIAEWVAVAPERFVGFAAVLPNERVVDQLEEAAALGLRGVGELHPAVQRFCAQDSAWRQLADWCVGRGWPVNLHVTEAAGHQYPGATPTPLEGIVELAANAPELPLILAHWGGGLPFFEQNRRVRKLLRNVRYDCAASPLVYEPGIFRRVADLVGIDKLLFGSDFPLRLYPRSGARADFSRFLGQIRSESGLSTAELEALLGGNFAKLIR